MKSLIYNRSIYLLLFSLLLFCLHTEAQVRVVDNKGTISTIPIHWTRVAGTTKDIYNTNLGNVGVGIIKPMATFHNAGSTILGAKAGNTTLSSSDNLIYSDYTVFNYSASASGVTLSLPATMIDATAGRLLTITNTGTINAFDVSFSTGAVVTLPVGYAQSFVWNGTAWTPQSSPVALSVPISGLTAATKNNSIDNTNYTQTWNWSTATTQSPMALSAPALTDGNLLSISGGAANMIGNLLKVNGASTYYGNAGVWFNFSGDHIGHGFYLSDMTTKGNAMRIWAEKVTTGNALYITGGSDLTTGSLINATAAVAATTTKGLLNIANTAASSTGTVATIQANSTASSGLTVLANGNVGVGTAAPTAALQLQAGTSVAGTAPLKLTSSSTNLLTTPETGAIEFDGTHLYCTIGTTRYQLDQQNPISGEIKIWPGAIATTLPTGWLVCDGSAISRTTYASLYLVIGTTYGAGDGSTTFNLPNLKGRVPVGYDVSQTEFNALNKTGGEKTHTLTIAEMPNHNHANGGYNVLLTYSGGSNSTGGLDTTGGEPDVHNFGYEQNVGGNGAHNNLQPYITMNYIIKY